MQVIGSNLHLHLWAGFTSLDKSSDTDKVTVYLSSCDIDVNQCALESICLNTLAKA